MTAKMASAPDSHSMEAQVKMPKEEASALVNAVTGFADKAAKQNDRWWLSVLMLIGIVVLGFMLKWHREDQAKLTEIFTTTLRSNTEALSKIGFQMERVEKELVKSGF